MNISIFGLGYVGTVTSACLARHGHRIIGVDTNATKVELLARGSSPIVEPGVSELLEEAHRKGLLSATTDHTGAVVHSDVSIICVGTPSNPNGSLNLDHIFSVTDQIAGTLRRKGQYHAIALRSTVLPGTIENVVKRMEQGSGKKGGADFGVASNPEFLREGAAVHDFENPPFTVIGTSDSRLIGILKEMYRSIDAPVHVVNEREAELLKYACNSFHAAKVAFANEIGSIAKKLNIDSHVVMDLFCADTKLNVSPAYLKPGFAFGGSCLPKDVRALCYAARSNDVQAPLLEALVPSNKIHIQRAVDWILTRNKKHVGVLGLSFKGGTDDLRESPVVEMVETILGKGFTVSIYDANVNLARLVGANKRYIEQEIPHISSLMKKSVAEVLDSSDVIVIGNKAEAFREALQNLKPHQAVLDLVRITDTLPKTGGSYNGICW